MLKITRKWLDKKRACCSEIDKIRAEKEFFGDPILILGHLLEKNRGKKANWLITNLMDKKQCSEYAIFAAEQVIHIFKEQCPIDKRPEIAIDAAKKCLKNPCKKTKIATRKAADDAAAAADTSNTAAALATSYVALATSYVARAIYYATTDAYDATYYVATDGAKAAYYAANAINNTATYKKIVRNGIKILKKGECNV